MGWANCGTDKRGRPIGYAHVATCDFEGCDEVIDRGLAFACGGMHGEVDKGDAGAFCDGYFCHDHLYTHGCPTGATDDDDVAGHPSKGEEVDRGE